MGEQDWAKIVKIIDGIFRDYPDLENVQRAHAPSAKVLTLRQRLEKDFRRVYISGQESIMKLGKKE